MLRFFSVPILCGLSLGVVFPYQALSMLWLSSFLLALLLFLNTLIVDPRKLFSLSRARLLNSLATLVLIFIFWPVVQTAAAHLVLTDRDFVLGLAVSSLAPTAFVVPSFARLRGGDASLSLLHVVLSTLICPLLMVPMLQVLGFTTVYLEPKVFIINLFALTTIPVLLAFAAVLWRPRLSQLVTPKLPYLNSAILALLMFIVVGSSLNRVPLRIQALPDVLWLVGLYLLMDFGVYFVMRHASRAFTGPREQESLALSVATRNLAVSASVMLFFHPKAALPSAVGLMVHCLYFQWLVLKGHDSSKL